MEQGTPSEEERGVKLRIKSRPSIESPSAAPLKKTSPEQPVSKKEKKIKKPKEKKPPKEKNKFPVVPILIGLVTAGAISWTVYALAIGQLDTLKNIEEVTIDRAGREVRYAYFSSDDGVANTDAERWDNGEWTGYSSEALFINLNPTGTYSEPMAFIEGCGPQCFFDPDKFPAGGRPVVEEMLGLTPAEYDYYSTHLSEWGSIKGGLIERLKEKYPNDPWFPKMFNLSPTDLKSKQPSDFENWYNKWHEIGQQTGVFNPNITTARGRIQVVGINQFKNAFAGRQNLMGAASKGRGFGTSKGFS